MATGREMRAKLVLSLSDRATQGLLRLQGRLQAIVGTVKGIGAITGLSRALTSFQALAGGALAGAGIARSIQSAADFQTALVDLTNTMNLTGEAARLKQIEIGRFAEQLARRYSTSVAKVLEGMQNLMAQGLPEQAMRGMIGDVMALSVAERAAVSASAELAGSLHTVLDIPVNKVGDAIGRIITGGRLGAVEIRDFAGSFATLATQMRGLGVTGEAAVATIVAGLETARKGAGTAGEAITNFDNLVSKFAAPETVRAFRDFGVDLPGVFKNAERQGVNAFDAIIQQIRRVTGGDPFKMAELFGDMQANKALRPLIGFIQEFVTMREQIAMADRGVLDSTLVERLKTFQSQMDMLGENVDAVGRRLGRGFALGLGEVNRSLAGFIDWWDALPSKIGHAHENWERLKGSMNGFVSDATARFDNLVALTLGPFNRALEAAEGLLNRLRSALPSWLAPPAGGAVPNTQAPDDPGRAADRPPFGVPARRNSRWPNGSNPAIRPQSWPGGPSGGGEDGAAELLRAGSLYAYRPLRPNPGRAEPSLEDDASAWTWREGGKLQIELILDEGLRLRRTDTEMRNVTVSASLAAPARGRMLPAV